VEPFAIGHEFLAKLASNRLAAAAAAIKPPIFGGFRHRYLELVFWKPSIPLAAAFWLSQIDGHLIDFWTTCQLRYCH
jgi:hypothetical protein